MKRLVAMLAMISVTGAMLLGGCGKAQSAATGKQDDGKSKAEETRLNLWLPPFADKDGDLTDAEFWSQAVAPFEKENHCKISIEIIPWDSYEEKYLTGMSSPDGPDVGYMYMEMFYDYIHNDQLVDMDSFFTEKEKENYVYYNLGHIQGGQFALPFVVGNPRVLIANMDLLKKAGVDQVPSTWEELEETGLKIKKSEPEVAPLMQDWGNPHYGSLNEIFWPFFWSAGGEITDDKGNLTIDSAAGKKAVAYLTKLREEGVIPESATSNDDTVNAFKTGEAAMIIIGTANALATKNIHWDFTPLLKGPLGDKSKTFVACDCLVLPKRSKNVDLSMKLIKYLTSAKVMSDFHERLYHQPPITMDDPYKSEDVFASLYTDYADTMQALPVFSNATGMYDALYKNLQSVMLGQMKGDEALSETTRYYNENLK